MIFNPIISGSGSSKEVVYKSGTLSIDEWNRPHYITVPGIPVFIAVQWSGHTGYYYVAYNPTNQKLALEHLMHSGVYDYWQSTDGTVSVVASGNDLGIAHYESGPFPDDPEGGSYIQWKYWYGYIPD